MKIKVVREFRSATETLGTMYINDKFFCYTLEDFDRKLKQSQDEEFIKANKIQKLTAMPSGNYRVILSISNRFQRLMPEVLNVKGFAGIRIHGGNTHENTEGCILIAKNRFIDKPSTFGKIRNWIQGSMEVQLIKEIQKALNKNETIELSIA
tara:strand:+ start:18320 stop:18775 length:456 start_codon:yes stop_codon:yes gene_type:complete